MTRHRSYYSPVLAMTGARHQQPSGAQLHISLWAHLPDFSESVDMGGFIDAPEMVPTGSVRALDTGAQITLGIATVARPRWSL